jgi:lysophospholipid acyltransferase (LPLAT)-like uncharacterized protein
MKLTHPLLQKAAAGCAAALGAVLRWTNDWRAVYFDPRVDPFHPHNRDRFIYLGWHEYLLLPILLRGSPRSLALVSGHSDGLILGRVMRHLGFRIAHGSSTRGGTAALLRLLRDRTQHIGMTPDGPHGPRRTMTIGAVYLASRLGIPVVCVGYGYDRPWRGRGWDRFAVPRPFSRGRSVWGPPRHVPPHLDRTGLERYRLWFEHLLNWLTEEAEAWAASGERRPGEAVMQYPAPGAALLRAPERSAPPLPAHLEDAWDALPASSAPRLSTV